MIIITDISSAINIEIPVTLAKSSTTGYSLALRNTVKKTTTTISSLTDTGSTDFFYKFNVDLSTYDYGEYEYTLSQDNETLATGVIRLVDHIDRNIYNQTITYKYYDANNQ